MPPTAKPTINTERRKELNSSTFLAIIKPQGINGPVKNPTKGMQTQKKSSYFVRPVSRNKPQKAVLKKRRAKKKCMAFIWLVTKAAKNRLTIMETQKTVSRITLVFVSN